MSRPRIIKPIYTTKKSRRSDQNITLHNNVKTDANKIKQVAQIITSLFIMMLIAISGNAQSSLASYEDTTRSGTTSELIIGKATIYSDRGGKAILLLDGNVTQWNRIDALVIAFRQLPQKNSFYFTMNDIPYLVTYRNECYSFGKFKTSRWDVMVGKLSDYCNKELKKLH